MIVDSNGTHMNGEQGRFLRRCSHNGASSAVQETEDGLYTVSATLLRDAHEEGGPAWTVLVRKKTDESGSPAFMLEYEAGKPSRFLDVGSGQVFDLPPGATSQERLPGQ